MKTLSSILFFTIIIFSLTSCTKESFDKKIVGKWQIKEIYNGIAGSPFRWNTIPEEYRYSIEFLEDGSFIKTEGPVNLPNVCMGTYSLPNENEIILSSRCINSSQSPNNLNLAHEALTITYEVFEGEIKEKFIKVQ